MAKVRKLDDHHDHDHFECACGEVFHTEEELEAHKKELHAT